jgi:hypothetical protein
MGDIKKYSLLNVSLRAEGNQLVMNERIILKCPQDK